VKDYLQQITASPPNNLLKRSVAREYLQARILQSLQDTGAFLRWAFLGGTALRFLYSMPRYSEDLDFSVLDPSEDVRFRAALEHIRTVFESENYNVRIKLNDRKTVYSAFIRFPGLPRELGLSPHAAEVLSVRLEIDTRPPEGAIIETTLVRRYVALNLSHYDKASLLAGKLHSVLARGYAKGRDLYDLVWYLSDRSWPAPNLSFLNAALSQTHWNGPPMTSANWRSVVAERLEGINWDQAAGDARPFLERDNDVSLLSRENCLALLRV
jgi:predicted nucleotidyltransferase component of viral defense system